MTRLRRRPTPPPAGTPTSRERKQKEGQSSARRQGSGGTRPKPAARTGSGPVDRLRPNLFISPVIGRARLARTTARKADLEKPAARSKVTTAGKTPGRTEKKRAVDAAKGSDPAKKASVTVKNVSSETPVSRKRRTETAAKPAVASEGKASSQCRAKKESATDTRSASQAAATEVTTTGRGHAKKTQGADASKIKSLTGTALQLKTPSRARAKRGRETASAQSNSKSPAVRNQKTSRQAELSKGRVAESSVQAVPSSKGKTPGQTRTKKESATTAARPLVAPLSETPSQSKPTAKQPAVGQSDDSSIVGAKSQSRTGTETDAKAADVPVSGRQTKAVSAAAGGRTDVTAVISANNRAGTVSELTGGHGSMAPVPFSGQVKSSRPSKPVLVKPSQPSSAPFGGQVKSSQPSKPALAKPSQPSGDQVKLSRSPKPASGTSTSPAKRQRAAAAPPSGPAAAATNGVSGGSETPSKRQRLSTTTLKAVTFHQEEREVTSPTRFTAILPRPPIPPVPPISTSAPGAPPAPSTAASEPLPPSVVVSEPLPPAATPRRRRLPRHVTSTPCGPPAPPAPAADSAEACYGFLEDIEDAEGEDEGGAPLEQVVSPVGVSRARPPPPPPRQNKLRDTTNLPSRFNPGRVVRKPAGERPEVTTTVASQLMDPEVTFVKPASRSYSRRRHPSTSAGHSTLGSSTFGSETSAAAAGDVTRAKQRRHHRKEWDEQELAEMEKWAAFVNSRHSEVDSFELVVERT